MKDLKFSSQFGEYGCFVTAVYNALIYNNCKPPNKEYLLKLSKCEIYNKTINKPNFLKKVGLLNWKITSFEDVINSQGIIPIEVYSFNKHFIFIFNENNKIYAVNSFIRSNLVLEINNIDYFKENYYLKLEKCYQSSTYKIDFTNWN